MTLSGQNLVHMRPSPEKMEMVLFMHEHILQKGWLKSSSFFLLKFHYLYVSYCSRVRPRIEQYYKKGFQKKGESVAWYPL